MLTLIEIMLGAMLIGVTVFSSIQLFLEEKFRQDQRTFLIATLLLHALYTTGDLLILTEAILAMPHLAGFQLPFNTLLGPSIYFYARSMMSSKTIWLYRKDALALLGPTAVALSLIPIALLDKETKLALADPAIRDPMLFAKALSICSFAFVVFLLFLYFYLFLALRRRKNYQNNLQNHFSSLDRRSLGWLRLTLVILALGWAWTSYSSIWQIVGNRPEWIGAFTAAFQLVFVCAFTLGAVTQPPIVLPNSMDGGEANASKSSKDGLANASYQRSALTPDRMTQIASKLEHAMLNDRLFEQAGLSLRQLSDYTGVSENYISETLNRHLFTNFYEFVNKWRINEACSLLEGSQSTVLDIAYQTGFNTRSTFNTAFKKHTGKTPREFRSRVHTQQSK